MPQPPSSSMARRPAAGTRESQLPRSSAAANQDTLRVSNPAVNANSTLRNPQQTTRGSHVPAIAQAAGCFRPAAWLQCHRLAVPDVMSAVVSGAATVAPVNRRTPVTTSPHPRLLHHPQLPPTQMYPGVGQAGRTATTGAGIGGGTMTGAAATTGTGAGIPRLIPTRIPALTVVSPRAAKVRIAIVFFILSIGRIGRVQPLL